MLRGGKSGRSALNVVAERKTAVEDFFGGIRRVVMSP